MKKLLIVVLLSLTLSVAQGAVPAPSHHWALDGDATDSGSGVPSGLVDGTASAGLTYGPGAVGQCAVLNGTNAYVDLASSLLPVTDKISLAFWVNVTTGDVFDSFISTDGWSGQAIHSVVHAPDSGGDYKFCVGTGVSGSSQMHTTQDLLYGKWNFCAWTFDSTTPGGCVFKFYVNGVLDSTQTVTATTDLPYQAATIGAWDGTSRFLQGKIDEMKIWNVILTDAEIVELYAAGLKTAWGPDPADDAEAIDPAGLILGWNAPGAFATAPTYNVYLGTTSGSLTLKSTSQSGLTYTPTPGLSYATEYFWRVDVNDPNGMAVHTGDEWSFTTAQVRDPIPSDGNVNASTEPLLRWKGAPIVDTYEVWFGTTSPSTSLGTTTLEDSSELTLPTLSPNTTYKWQVNSNIGAVNLTGPVWTFTTGRLIGKWTLDGNAADTSGFGNNGTISGATSVPTEKAYLFDGDSSIDLPATVYNPVTTGISVALWSKGDTSLPTGANYIYSAVTSGDVMVARCHLPYYGLVVYDSGNSNSAYNRVIQGIDSESQIKDQWNHWVFTSDTDSGDMKVYHNGQLWATTTGQTLAIGDPFAVAIGMDASAVSIAGEGYKGMIKDVRVYDMEVGPNLAATIYAEGPYAINPNPADGEEYVLPTAVLSWTAGVGATSHDVYFGTDPEALSLVSDNQAGTTYDPTGDMTPGQTYYWRVDENAGATTWVSGAVWSFTVLPYEANQPTPEDGAAGVDPLTTVLGWTSGWQATSHDVYFGTVGNLLLVSSGQAGTTYDPGVLAYNQEYVWRIDEHAGATTYPGVEWSFTTLVPDCPTAPVGDINGDCIVDLADFAEIAANWLSCNLVPATACP